MKEDIKQKNITISKWWQRFYAFIIDCFFLGLLIHLFAYITRLNFESWNGVLILLIFYFGYFTILPYFYSRTIGGFIFGIKIIDANTLQKVSWHKLILRNVLFLTIFTGIGCLFFLIKGYYWDSISKIIVIKETKK